VGLASTDLDGEWEAATVRDEVDLRAETAARAA
jgi:hypothetical protein